jgi:hypothetical protein
MRTTGFSWALQGSKVARSQSKVPSLHQDPKDVAKVLGFIQHYRVPGIKGFRVPRFQRLSLQVFQGSMVPGFSDT